MDCFYLQGSEVSHFVLIAGEPINEPVVQQGMFSAFPLLFSKQNMPLLLAGILSTAFMC